jgi:predicted nucleic-acid-binding protein
VIGLDTNVLVRSWSEMTSRSISARSPCWRAARTRASPFVGDVVLAELSWVLRSAYRVPPDEIAGALTALLEASHLEFEASHLEFESADRVRRALLAFTEGRAGFADYLLLERAREAGCDSLAAFDVALRGAPGVVEP